MAPACKKYRHAPLEYEDGLDVIFHMSTLNMHQRICGICMSARCGSYGQSGSVDNNSPIAIPIGDMGEMSCSRIYPAKKSVKNQAPIGFVLNQCPDGLSTIDNKITKKLTTLAAISTSLGKWVKTSVTDLYIKAPVKHVW